MSQPACWCGNRDLVQFGRDYLECRCGTLVRSAMPAQDVTRVDDEDHDLYGKNYWFEHQAALGLPDIQQRAAADLHERCLHWLRIVLGYKTPPARVLEIGAAHGGFVGLLAAAGFDATGLELSPWIVDYARRSTGARMLLGPVEQHSLEPQSCDLIVAFDVLEHLPDPVRTLTRCADLLRAGGLLLIQTPCRQPGVDHAEASRTRFRDMLIPEHLFLFSESSLRQLLERVGLPYAAIERSIFETDMTLIAGRQAPRRLSVAATSSDPPGRHGVVDLLLSFEDAVSKERHERRRQMVDLEERYRAADRDRIERQRQIDELQARYRAADRDRIERQRQIDELQARYRAADRDRIERQRQIDELQARYRAADRDRIERQRQIDELQARYRQADQDRIERQLQIERLDALLVQADRDRVERLRRVEEIQALLAEADRDRAAVRRQLASLQELYKEADRDRAERLCRMTELETLYRQADEDRTARLRRVEELESLYREADEHRAAGLRRIEEFEKLQRDAEDERAARLHEIRQLEQDVTKLALRYALLRGFVADHRTSPVYRSLVALGRWRAWDACVEPLLDDGVPAPAIPERGWHLRPASRGAAPGTIAFDLTAILPGGENGGAKLVATELVRLLACLDRTRRFVLLTSSSSHHEVAALDAPNVTRRLVDPGPTTLSELVEEENVAVLFCPMTAPPFEDPRVPLICLVNDLQFLTYPGFFADADRQARQGSLDRVERAADHVVTPSEYVRRTVLQHSSLSERQVSVIPHGFLGTRFTPPSEREIGEALERHGLERGRYFLYPANFWRHKNHLMLLVAFGQLRQRRPDLDLRLVLTGAGRPDPRAVAESAARMGLAHRVLMPGYLPDSELALLMAGAQAVIFPSLYEGYGLPIVEAFAIGCAVACSGVTSLPEVAAEAALYFDPRTPGEIADALEQLATRPSVAEELRVRGQERLRQLPAAPVIAREYLSLIDRVAAAPRSPRNQLAGVFSDGWTSSTLVVAHGGGGELLLDLENPREDPVTLAAEGVESLSIDPHRALTLRCFLPARPGTVEISIGPPFRPSDRGASSDTRKLGVRLRGSRLLRAGLEPLDLGAAAYV